MAHVDHGKTSLSDHLIGANGLIHPKLQVWGKCGEVCGGGGACRAIISSAPMGSYILREVCVCVVGKSPVMTLLTVGNKGR